MTPLLSTLFARFLCGDVRVYAGFVPLLCKASSFFAAMFSSRWMPENEMKAPKTVRTCKNQHVYALDFPLPSFG